MSSSGRRSDLLQVVCQTQEQVRSSDELIRAGWERRFMGEATRAEEARELYTSLGFDVHLESPRAEHFADECQACASACDTYVLVYTRKRGSNS
jgi:hypothetical protein